MKTKNLLTYEELGLIDYEGGQLEYRKDSLLRKAGWKHTCDTPGSVWLWERKLEDGRTVLVSTGTALHIQISIESVTASECRDCGAEIHPQEELCGECECD